MKTIRAFFAGITLCFTVCFAVASIMLMSPEDMRRWALNDSPNGEKVERALSPESVRMMKLKEQIIDLQNDLAGKVKEFDDANKIYRDENEKLRKSLALEELKINLSISDKNSIVRE
jgi:TolA-binding protein